MPVQAVVNEYPVQVVLREQGDSFQENAAIVTSDLEFEAVATLVTVEWLKE